MFSVARLRASTATLLSILAVMALVTGFSIGTSAFLDAQGGRGVQAGLATRAGADVALRASLTVAENPDRQDEAVRAAITRTFAGTGVPFAVDRTVSSHVTVRPDADAAEPEDRGGSAASVPDIDDLVVAVSGAAPTASIETFVQADAAAALGIATGDHVLLAGEPFVVTGTWRARDLLDPRWYGDPMVATGFNDDYGPFLITDAAWSRLDVEPTANWTLVPDLTRIDSRNIGAIVAAWSGIRDEWRGEVPGLETLTPERRLVDTLRDLEARLDGLRAVEPVVFTLVAAAALVALAELARLLVATRTRETTLYWSRGDSATRIAARMAAEVGTASLVGAVVGSAAAALVLARTGSLELAALGTSAWITPVVVALGGCIVAASAAHRSAAAPVRAAPRAAGSIRRAALPGIVVLAVLAAALTVWQLRIYGSPLTPTADGSGTVDPIAVVAPAAALVAAVLALLAAFPALAAANERRARRSGLTAQLAARGLVRRRSIVVAPFVVVCLAVGSATIAAAYAATWDYAFTETAQLRAGSVLHVDSRLEGIGTAAQDAVRSTPGVDQSAPLEVQPFSIGTESGTLMGISPQALTDLATLVPGQFDPAVATSGMRTEVPAPAVPQGATSLTLTIEAVGFDAPPELAAYLTDALGQLRRIAFDPARVASTATDGQVLSYTARDLGPATDGTRSLVALDFAFADQDFEHAQASVALRGLTAGVSGADQELDLDQFWIADSEGQRVEGPTTDATGSGFFLSAEARVARMTPSLNGTLEDFPQVPVVVSEQLASRFDVRVGDALSFSIQDGIDRLSCVVAGIVPVVPGTSNETALLLDLGVIQHYQLRTSEVPAAPRDLWVTTADPAGVQSALRDVLPANTRIDSRDDEAGRDVLGAAATTLWAAALCVGALALIGIASSARARLRVGRNDVAVLRALGLRSRDQAGILSTELTVVLVLGAAGGLLAGLLVSVLTIPYFARAAITLPYVSITTGMRIDLLGLGLVGAGLLLGLVLVILAVRRGVRRQVRTAMPEEDTE